MPSLRSKNPSSFQLPGELKSPKYAEYCPRLQNFNSLSLMMTSKWATHHREAQVGLRKLRTLAKRTSSCYLARSLPLPIQLSRRLRWLLPCLYKLLAWTQNSSCFFKEAPPAALKVAGMSFLEEALALFIWFLDVWGTLTYHSLCTAYCQEGHGRSAKQEKHTQALLRTPLENCGLRGLRLKPSRCGQPASISPCCCLRGMRVKSPCS